MRSPRRTRDLRFQNSSVTSVGRQRVGKFFRFKTDAHRFEHTRVALRIRRMAGEFFQEHPRQKSAHEREAAELQRNPFEWIAAGMARWKNVETQIQRVHQPRERAYGQDDLEIAFRL